MLNSQLAKRRNANEPPKADYQILVGTGADPPLAHWRALLWRKNCLASSHVYCYQTRAILF
jgi:hypothetical protein